LEIQKTIGKKKIRGAHEQRCWDSLEVKPPKVDENSGHSGFQKRGRVKLELRQAPLYQTKRKRKNGDQGESTTYINRGRR